MLKGDKQHARRLTGCKHTGLELAVSIRGKGRLATQRKDHQKSTSQSPTAGPKDILRASGVFTLPPRECMQKVAALYSLALQARVVAAQRLV